MQDQLHVDEHQALVRDFAAAWRDGFDLLLPVCTTRLRRLDPCPGPRFRSPAVSPSTPLPPSAPDLAGCFE